MAEKNSPGGGRNIEISADVQRHCLLIRVKMPPGEARAIAERANRTGRSKSEATGFVREALRGMKGEPRKTAGLLQGDIPADLQRRVREVARGTGLESAVLLRNLLHTWIDPHSGNRRKRISKTTPSGVAFLDPGWSKLGEEGRPLKERARLGGNLARLQIEVGPKTADTVRRLLKEAKIPMGVFLAALAQRACRPDGPVRTGCRGQVAHGQPSPE